MKKDDLIQDLSICGLKYARILTARATPEELEAFKKTYSYINIYCYSPFVYSGFTSRIQPTLLIDLSQDLDQIFGNFNANTRNHVHRAENNGDLELKVFDTAADISYKFYSWIKSLDGAHPDLKREFSRCHLLNAYWTGKMIVTMSFYDNGSYIRSKHIASSRKFMGKDAKVVAHASRALIWEVCKWSKAHGRGMFDLGGINYTDASKAGIREFKRSFGGIETDVGIHRYATRLFLALKRGLNVFNKNID
jgi:lipid II:glycine glycyltransferase (peptidoglycan interpeptide bridge formation enzyme)